MDVASLGTAAQDRQLLEAGRTEAGLRALMRDAVDRRLAGFGTVQTYSPKVFIPLTQLCRDVCHYCTFAQAPRSLKRAFLTYEQVLEIARAGEAAGCTEALFTLGEKPERRYTMAREELARLGHDTTLSYLREVCALVLRETGLMPHVNPGTLAEHEMRALRAVSVSQGMMLESLSPRLTERGGAHFGSPDKDPDARLEVLRLAGKLAVPFTTGILVGIGETRQERLDALRAIRASHEAYGHIQDVIIQNFRAKPGTRMAGSPEPSMDDLLWTIAAARIILGPEMSIQAPPNLSQDDFGALLGAGINDWGGISPVTIDHVNPEAPWPELGRLQRETEAQGMSLVPRLPLTPSFAADPDRWVDPALRTRVIRASDSTGHARGDGWAPGGLAARPAQQRAPGSVSAVIADIVARATQGETPTESQIVTLFEARGASVDLIADAADRLRQQTVGDDITYVVTRNINYTNICSYHCQFCAFSKGRGRDNLRGSPYMLDVEEVGRRVAEAHARGATEVCMQGGIHPSYTGETYLELLRAAKQAAPDIHVHAFSPLEVSHGARTMGLSLPRYLERLADAGLGSLPGTAAEILDDEVRATLCADKLSTAGWLEVIGAAHDVGLRTTSTIMFGHVDRPVHWARHLLHIRRLQTRTRGFTEFVPLPFVHMESPLWIKGQARNGPTWREVLLMHAVARLVLHPVLTNIQVSWVKTGLEGSLSILNAGANDFGGTLMNESISRAAGASHGQELTAARIESAVRSIGRVPRMRTTLYADACESRRGAAMGAGDLAPLINAAPRRFETAKRIYQR